MLKNAQIVLVQRINYRNTLFIVYFRNVIGYTWLLAIGLLWQQYQPENTDYYNARTWKHWKRKNLIVAPLSIIAFAAGYVWYQSIFLTHISVNTAIYNCNFSTVFILSVVMIREKVTWSKMLSTALSVIGVFLVTFDSIGSNQWYTSKSEVTGIGLALLAIFFFALYAVLMKCIEISPSTRQVISGPIPHAPQMVGASDGMNVLGLLGFWNMILVIPFLALAHVFKWEAFELPTDMETWSLLFINAGLNTLFNIGLLMGIAFATPFTMSLGLILSIPLSIFLDTLLNNYLLGTQASIGAGCIMFGYVFMTYTEYYRPKVIEVSRT